MHDKTQKEHSYDTVTPNTACRTLNKFVLSNLATLPISLQRKRHSHNAILQNYMNNVSSILLKYVRFSKNFNMVMLGLNELNCSYYHY
jgi:hypothetical protein